MAPVRLVLHRLSCSNETARNALKHEFWVQWSGSGAFVAKDSNATLFSELVREWHQFDLFCIDFGAVTKRSKMPQNMSFGFKGVDPVRSLRTIPKQLNLANFRVNDASSTSFVATFVH
jgi:hypothetical protein